MARLTIKRRGLWAKLSTPRVRRRMARDRSFMKPSRHELSRRLTEANAIRSACAMPDWSGWDMKAERTRADNTGGKSVGMLRRNTGMGGSRSADAQTTEGDRSVWASKRWLR